MGRSNKVEQPSETPKFQETYGNNSGNSYSGQETHVSTNRVSDADSMVREIKDGRLSGFVGNGTTLNGEMNFQALLRVDGQLTGRITSENGTLIVGATGRIEANVAVFAAVINGIVKGDIVATEKIELGRTAQVIGNIQAPRLVMEDGAILEGSCTMLKAKELFDKRVASDKSRFNEPATLDMTTEKSEVAVS
jgi:cytoskeletal protein CcmA (bactofilin family)